MKGFKMSLTTSIKGYIPALKSDTTELYITSDGSITTDYRNAKMCNTENDALQFAISNNLEEFTPIALTINGWNLIVRSSPIEIDYDKNNSVWDDDHYLVDWDY